jgi:predicted nucleic acid-binding protein
LLEDNDLFIAATAMSRGLTLITHDRGFSRIADLSLEDWLQ